MTADASAKCVSEQRQIWKQNNMAQACKATFVFEEFADHWPLKEASSSVDDERLFFPLIGSKSKINK